MYKRKTIRTDYKSAKKNTAMKQVIRIENEIENYINRHTKSIDNNKFSGDWIGIETEWSDNWFSKPMGLHIRMTNTYDDTIQEWNVSCNKKDGKYIVEQIAKTLTKRSKNWDIDAHWGDDLIRIIYSIGDRLEII